MTTMFHVIPIKKLFYMLKWSKKIFSIEIDLVFHLRTHWYCIQKFSSWMKNNLDLKHTVLYIDIKFTCARSVVRRITWGWLLSLSTLLKQPWTKYSKNLHLAERALFKPRFFPQIHLLVCSGSNTINDSHTLQI